MPRLFIAIAPDDDASAALVALQPAPQAGLRPVARDQLHLTLHFIGEAQIAPVAAALRNVDVPAFDMCLRGVGSFGGEGGATLWVGVEPSESLLRLYAAVGRELARLAIPLESRPFRPHVTVARCKGPATQSVARDFLDRNAGFASQPMPVCGFGLYSSTNVEGRPVYRVEASVALAR